MQLCKILHANEGMLPPKFGDWQVWVRFQSWLDFQLHLKHKIESRAFSIVTIIIIVLTFVNSCSFLFTRMNIFAILDDIFMIIFCVEIILKMLGLGL